MTNLSNVVVFRAFFRWDRWHRNSNSSPNWPDTIADLSANTPDPTVVGRYSGLPGLLDCIQVLTTAS